jgi:hypothetical protein
MSTHVPTRALEPIEMYCRSERAIVRCDRGSVIVCPDGHEVAKDFPGGEIWTYCCGCRKFTPIDVIDDGFAFSQCFQCERVVARRFLCSECSLLTTTTGDASTPDSFILTEQGKPLPSCPGCLKSLDGYNLAKHECKSTGVTYLTTRLVCPFCQQRLSDIVDLVSSSITVETPARATPMQGLTFLENFANTKTSPEWVLSAGAWLKMHRPKTLAHWVAVISLTVTFVSIVVTLISPVGQASRAIIKLFRRSPRVAAIECEHIISQGQRVSLRARAEDPTGSGLRFSWSSSAGTIEGDGAQVYLNTEGIVPRTISTEITVGLVVTDAQGLNSPSFTDRVSVVARNVLNVPPRLIVPPMCYCSTQGTRVGEPLRLFASAEGKDNNETLTYDWQFSSPALETAAAQSLRGSTVTVNTAGVGQLSSPMPINVTLRVTGSYGGEISGYLTIMLLPREFQSGVGTGVSPTSTPVKPNHSPKLEFFTADRLTAERGEEVKLWVFATDADGDAPLYYDWRTSSGEILNKGDTAVFNTASAEPGRQTITVTISDGHGGTTSQKLFVSIQQTGSKNVSPSPTPAAADPRSPVSLPNGEDSGDCTGRMHLRKKD